MDDLTSNITNETKMKDGYTQLAEKMDQVKNQVARMERKYDELYQAVKEKDMTRSSNASHETSPEQQQQQSQDVRTHRESMLADKSPTKQIIKSDDSPRSMEESSKGQQPNSPTADMDIEKMEDNPFV